MEKIRLKGNDTSPKPMNKISATQAYNIPINKFRKAMNIVKMFGSLKRIKSKSPGFNIIVKNLIIYLTDLHA